MVRLIGLKNHPSAEQPSAGAAGNLGEYLESPLGGAVIGQVKTGVGGDHTH